MSASLDPGLGNLEFRVSKKVKRCQMGVSDRGDCLSKNILRLIDERMSASLRKEGEMYLFCARNLIVRSRRERSLSPSTRGRRGEL